MSDSLPEQPRAASAVVDWGYRLFPILLLPLMLVLSRDFGNTGSMRAAGVP